MEGVTEYDDLMKTAGLLHEESWGSSEKVTHVLSGMMCTKHRKFVRVPF